jgi:putative membrane protein
MIDPKPHLAPSGLPPDSVGRPNETPESDPRIALAGERTNAARFRTSLALDRTTLAWIRTALTFATFGFGMVGFFRTMVQTTQSEQAVRLHHAAIRMGAALIVIGMVSTILAAASHWMALRRLRRGEPLTVPQWPLTFAIAVLLGIIGLYALWSIFAP